MSRSIRLVAAAAAVAALAAQQAAAVGPGLWVVENGARITSTRSPVRFVVAPRIGATRVTAVAKRSGRVLHARVLAGRWGLQAATIRGTVAGLSADGRTLVLARPADDPGRLTAASAFVVLRGTALRLQERIRLRGDFTVDALGPDGRLLYLIEHLPGPDITQYRVRAYDLRARRLLPRVIADKRQAGWTMRGMPLDRVTGKRARWVYTLYSSGDNYPFVHALDTVSATAVCIGVPLDWRSDTVNAARLRLSRDGRTLAVDGPNVRKAVRIDTRTLRIVHRR